MGSVAVAAGCSTKAEDNLFTMVQATEDMVTGKEAWYASTCRECPAGCGVLAKNREGRIIKLEGNGLHPVNRGTLCMRGQAAWPVTISSVAWTMVNSLSSGLAEQPAATATLPMDAILRKVLRFMRDARSCQGAHADDMGGSGPAAILLTMDG